MISGGPTDRDNTNTRKTSLKRAKHEMISGDLRPEEE